MRAKGLRVAVSVSFACITTSVAVAQDRDVTAINQPQPSYPYLATLFHVEGDCDVRLSIDEEGLPFGLMTSCTHPIFCHEAERAVSKAEFLPKLVDGVPNVETDIVYPLSFRFGSHHPETGEWVGHFHGDKESHHEDDGPLAPCKEIPVS